MGDVNQIVYQYQRLVTQYKDLETQLKQKEEQWKKMQERFALVEAHARELCEDILAKDKSESGLGMNYSWSSVEILELLKKAKTSFQAYNSDRSKLLKQLLTQSESRRKELEQLKSQPMEAALSQNPKINKTLQKTAEIVESGVDDQTKHEATAVLEFYDDAEDIDVSVPKISGIKSIPQYAKDSSGKTHNNNSNNSQNITLDEVDTIVKKLSKEQQLIIRVMGETGKITLATITEEYCHYDQKSKTVLITEVRTLVNQELIKSESVNEGLYGRYNIYHLTALGENIYRRLYGKKAILSEWARIIQEHSSIEHGLNILGIAEKMRKYPKVYSYVREWNRNNPIAVQIPLFDVNTKKTELFEKQYVPDIIFKYRGQDQPHYIEYERNSCSQEQFNEKCEKMIKVSKTLRFVVPNAAELQKIIDRINIWISKRKNTLPRCTILVTGCRSFTRGDMSSNNQWDYEYNSVTKQWTKNH